MTITPISVALLSVSRSSASSGISNRHFEMIVFKEETEIIIIDYIESYLSGFIGSRSRS